MATAYQGDKPYIFLSYAHKDKELAHYVVDYLQAHNNYVWFDEGIHTGAQWKKFILEKIANPNCWMMVFLATQNSLVSDECEKELYFAEEKNKKFINVVIDSPQFPDWFICDFKRYQFVDEAEFASREAMMDKLVKELIHHEMNTDKSNDTPKETSVAKPLPTAKAPWVCKSCGSNNSGDDDVCEVCGSSGRYVAPKETPAPSFTEGLEFSIVDGTARVDHYKGTDTKVIIPAKITYDGNSYKVTTIGERAFKDCKNITSITIPDSVTSIGKLAFFDCTNLTSITIPESVTTIGKHAFEHCTNLTSINIPDSVTSIGESAFAWCKNLTSIDVDKNNTHYKSIDGNLYSRDGTLLIQYAIGKTATSFTIPNSVISIGERAFAYCENITSITIPNSVTTIGESAFWECTNLTSITIPDSVTAIGEFAFSECSSLTSITIPNSVTSIGDCAFVLCSSLTSITIPNSVTSIGINAFGGCESLTIYCEAKSKPEGWHSDWNPNNRPVVWNCVSSSPKEDEVCGSSKPSTDSTTTPKPSPTEGLEFSIVDGTAKVTSYKGTDTKVIIPATIIRDGKTYKVTSIGKSAFSWCENITSVTIPNSVTSIEDQAFFACHNLTSINIPDSVTSIGKWAFEYCDSLTSITIPDSMTTIGNLAFYGCTGLTSITIPNSVTSIGYGVFCECKNLTAVSIPNSVTSIGDYAFRECTSLTSVTIPNSVTFIGKLTFYGCTNLTSINIPDSVTSIGLGAFEDCDSLTSITIPESVTSIGQEAFWGCSSLTSITIPESVTFIGKWAFWNCKNLTSITIPDSVKSIGYRAFGWCLNLTIYCEKKSKPIKWHIDWNPDKRPVVWGCKLK